jgi:hypothetical protein
LLAQAGPPGQVVGHAVNLIARDRAAVVAEVGRHGRGIERHQRGRAARGQLPQQKGLHQLLQLWGALATVVRERVAHTQRAVVAEGTAEPANAAAVAPKQRLAL